MLAVAPLLLVCKLGLAFTHGGWFPPPPPPPPGGGSTGGGPGGPTGAPNTPPSPPPPGGGSTGGGPGGPTGGPTGGGPWGGPGDGPSTPTPGSGSTPTGSGPGKGSGPTTPTPAPASTGGLTGSPSTVGGPTGAGLTGGGIATGVASSYDLDDWQLWWRFHRDEFLDLGRTLAHAGPLATGVSGFDDGGGFVAPDPKRVSSVVVPALMRQLEGERNADVLTSSMVALAKIGRGPCPGDAPAIEAALRKHLRDPVQEVAETAALALGLNGTPAAGALLAALARDDAQGRELVGQTEVPYRTRAFACYGLGLFAQRAGNPDAHRFTSHHLIATFEADSTATRDVKTAVLVALSMRASGPAARKPAARPAGARVGGGGGTLAADAIAEAELAWLEQLWKNERESELVRAFVPTSAARIASRTSEAAADRWKALLTAELAPGRSRNAVLRQSSATALGFLVDDDDDLADQNARIALERQMREGEHFTRRLAAIALGRSAARTGAGEGGEKNREATRRALRGELADASGQHRPWLALALGVSDALQLRAGMPPTPIAREALAAGLEQRKSAAEAGAWCLAAGLARCEAGRDRIVWWTTENQDAPARPHAALALGLLGWDGAVLSLRRVLPDARYRPLLLRDASIALGILGSDDVVKRLTQMLGESQSLAAHSAISSALTYVGDARALDALLPLVERGDRPDGVRAFAAAAIGGLCDPQREPWNAELARGVCYWAAPATLFEPASAMGILDLL
jgi:hypothetical protein